MQLCKISSLVYGIKDVSKHLEVWKIKRVKYKRKKYSVSKLTHLCVQFLLILVGKITLNESNDLLKNEVKKSKKTTF